MSKNNNSNNNRSNNNNGGNTNSNNGSRSNNRGRRNNDNSRNNNGNSNSNNNDNSNNNRKKGACEELRHNVFDCGSRKKLKPAKKSSKAMAAFLGTGKDFGKEASNLKCIMEHLDDPELKPPDDFPSTDSKNETPWFKCTEAHRQHMDKKDSSLI